MKWRENGARKDALTKLSTGIASWLILNFVNSDLAPGLKTGFLDEIARNPVFQGLLTMVPDLSKETGFL